MLNRTSVLNNPHCFRELGRPIQTERFARQSLHMNMDYVRGRAFNLALLASAHAQQGDAEAAATTGIEATRLIGDLKSVRAVGYIERLQIEMERFTGNRLVDEFNQGAGPLIKSA